MESHPCAPGANPVLARWTRGGDVESAHRGAWCLVDDTGEVRAGAGDWKAPQFVRSSIKAIQALPLLESGAAERFAFSDAELCLALSSHNGEPCHTETVRGTLERLGLDAGALRCGVHPPSDPAARAALRAAGEEPSALHNNCSGKHAGFLALAKHLGVPLERYLEPTSEGQRLVRRALAETSGVPEASLVPATDGCSAPTYRLPLVALATAFARLTSPASASGGLSDSRRAAGQRIVAAAAAHPVLLAGRHRRLDTDLVRASAGRLFPKVGAEAIYVIGFVEERRALALKIDDGTRRAMHAVVVGLLETLALARPAELEALAPWRDRRLRNHAGLEVGDVELCLAAG